MNWKAVERQVALQLDGQRVPITGRAGKPDVEHLTWAIEVKARTTMPKWIIAIFELLKGEGYVTCKLGNIDYLGVNLKSLKSMKISENCLKSIHRDKVTGWVQYGLDQAVLSSKGTDKIPVTIFHMKNWRYGDCVCLIPISYIEGKDVLQFHLQNLQSCEL